MSFSAFGSEEESIGWGDISAPVQATDLVSQAIRKEKIIKCVFTSTSEVFELNDTLLYVER
jgi:hypothetical protein